MVRHTLRSVGMVLLATLIFTTAAEAAGKKTVRHRTRHSSRVVAGKSGTAKKPQPNVKPAPPPAEAAPATSGSSEEKGKTSTKPR